MASSMSLASSVIRIRSDRTEICELVGDGAASGVQKPIVAVAALARAFEKLDRNKDADSRRLCRNVAANFFENALHCSNRFTVKSVHTRLPRPLDLSIGLMAFSVW